MKKILLGCALLCGTANAQPPACNPDSASGRIIAEGRAARAAQDAMTLLVGDLYEALAKATRERDDAVAKLNAAIPPEQK